MASRVVAVLVGLLSAAAPVAAAGQATKAEQEPAYNPASVINVMVTVTDIRVVPKADPLSGLHLMVKADKETLDSHLGPADFVKDCGVAFNKGDRIQVVGSKVKSGDGFILLVREVRKDNSTLYLRDQKGNPNWPPSDKDKGKT